MSMKKVGSKRIILLSAFTLPLACFGAIVLAKKLDFKRVIGNSTDYSFTLNENNAPATYGNNVAVVATGLGNSLIFNYVGASSSSGNHMALADGGYIQNVEKLMDLTTLSVFGTGTFKLHTGYEC